MSESKQSAASTGVDEEYLRALPVVEVDSIDVSPNPAALTDELNLEVDFRLDKPVVHGVWEIQLGEVEAQNYREGENHFQFSVPHIDVASIEPSQLTNCGLLIASFKNDEGDIMDLKMVVQVSEHRDGLQRIIYNPLE
ncbi:hypothetical protein Poli38472_002267 [Pythium oligandrum]|uniref:Uncharacterized protein n=1 Tax=Pythium oligandrum TaxID=41045 RepID=A0A8K1CID5_PYTOL|nr:hypothetical protein Poli38472_002267 [Pythium oligandrum]|eukprot:TMW63326.1 hypothetical protein Poli38472_002267 [Pythium oligandrum]